MDENFGGVSRFAIPSAGLNRVISLGPIQAAPLSRIKEEEEEAVEKAMMLPLVSSLAMYVRERWSEARDAKRNDIEDRMLKSVRARRGEYDPEVYAAIKQMGGSDVYAMLTSVKCRAAGSWLRDVLMANGTEKPWSIAPTPVPDLPSNISEAIIDKLTMPIAQRALSGNPMPDSELNALLGIYRDHALNEVRTQSRKMAQRMEDKMEDQLIEGGFKTALAQFVDDIVTYPAAIMKGPVVRMREQLKWEKTADGEYKPKVKRDTKLEWERVSPFDIYPSPEAENVNQGYLIEKHRLSRGDLLALIGVEGYNDVAIHEVLEEYGAGGLREWVYDDVGRAEAEGKSTPELLGNPDNLIDAIQYWGPLSGEMLLDWGMPEDQIPDPMQEYNMEVWLIGNYIIRAVRNSHPLGHKPYYKASYEEIPGSFWGNSPADLVRDAQITVNAATRALVNNMGLASGPQVVVNVERLADGENITSLRPWKIWQVTSDPMSNGYNQQPITFMQPDSRVAELAGIIEKFSQLADEWSGIPRYLTGDAPGGAGRTASGLSMLMSNAGKSLKQVVANIDVNVLKPLLENLHYWNMLYGEVEDLKGDVNIVVRGANALIAKESNELRRVEFLQLTANPIDSQIIGPEGRAQILREVAKGLDLDVDRIIPPIEILREKVQEEAARQAQNATQQAAGEAQVKEAAKAQLGSGQELADGQPTTDLFQQKPQ